MCAPVHRLLNAPQEVPGPHDAASHQGGVSGPGRVALLLLIDLLDCFQVFEIVVEDDLILGLQIRLQTDSFACLVIRKSESLIRNILFFYSLHEFVNAEFQNLGLRPREDKTLP